MNFYRYQEKMSNSFKIVKFSFDLLEYNYYTDVEKK